MVSVVLPIYKEKSEWIRESVDSILNQTYTDFELLLINDNPESVENINLIKDYEKKDYRVKGIFHEENMGLPKSLNHAIKLAKGEYIARMDADDWSFPERLEKQVAFMDANPDIIASGAMAYAWNGEKYIKKITRPLNYDDIVTFAFDYTPFVHPLLILRSEFINKNDIRYDENFRYSQDYKLTIDLLKHGKIVNIPEFLLKYRVSKKQISKYFKSDQDYFGKIIRRILVNNYYDSIGVQSLDKLITLDAIILNETHEKKILSKNNFNNEEKTIFKNRMRSIRRLLYYSLNKYSVLSMIHFLLSFDYLYCPYNLRRFGVILIKHFKTNFPPRLI